MPLSICFDMGVSPSPFCMKYAYNGPLLPSGVSRVKLPLVQSPAVNRPQLLRAGAALTIVLWVAGTGYWLADDVVAQRRATPEEALAIRWQLGTNKPDKPETGKPEAPKVEPPPAKSQNINDLFSVRKGGVEGFDPLSRNPPANAPIMVPDWPQRIIAASTIVSVPFLSLIGWMVMIVLDRRKAARLVAEAAEAKRQREIEFKKSFSPKRPVKHYQSKNLPRR
jgi:hypothetical protein